MAADVAPRRSQASGTGAGPPPPLSGHAANDDHSRPNNLGTVIGAPELAGLRYMRRRRVGTADRNGDPLDGIVNLFDVAIVLAVGFLVAALAAAGVRAAHQQEHDHRHQPGHARRCR